MSWRTVRSPLSLTYRGLTVCAVVPGGLGHHIWTAQPDANIIWAKGVFIGEIVYTFALAAVKFSILAFYIRIFQTRTIKLPTYILIGIVTGWSIAIVCPIRKDLLAIHDTR